ncbi:hypothetical protein [Gloeothece verrucosa]|uniref:Uncharacterized protein n=1 Tax=Gloeothece verrucosa (strain PCC 7822) TaxID=497965 RepID=E0UAU7_GLOV7|nr:hypothetical protein [Gloeothece verrucosa]ADN15069.1 hypothetical protein Cyan7822_3114 [Gloeothece verrucosa PCC 7822]
MSQLPQQIFSELLPPEQIVSSLRDTIPSLMFWLARLDPKDTDVIAQFQQSFKHFVQSGQVWALLIGVVIGYLFRGFTSY